MNAICGQKPHITKSYMGQKIRKNTSTVTTTTEATTITINKRRQIQSLPKVELFLDSKQRKSNSIQTRQDVNTPI